MSDAPSAESQRIFRDGLFADRVVIVTGGGSGIGLACATEFARLGANVAICGRTRATLDSACEALQAVAAAERIWSEVCDIRDADACQRFAAAVKERFGRVDVLVNNAGGQFPAPAQQISGKGFAAVVNNNLNGTFNMTHAVANEAMLPQRSGRIINIIANIYRGFPGMVHTGAARAGVENMTMTLAVEWASRGILVNAVAPGIIRSSGTERYPPALLEHAIGACPLRRAGQVDEVAAAVLFLASPGAQFITGATLRVDGAQSLHGDFWPTGA